MPTTSTTIRRLITIVTSVNLFLITIIPKSHPITSAFATSDYSNSASYESSSQIYSSHTESNICPSAMNDNNNNKMIRNLRSVRTILPRPPAHWVGDGFKVYPVFDKLAFTEAISPLLMFDYAEPKEFPPRPGKQPLGVGQHPHRGFETVTVAFQGEAEHHDSTGNTGVIKEGDVQWMTAGRGIIHEEYHSQELTNSGGTFEMCQLWVNLPKKHKMTKPGYQAIQKANIPVVNLPIGADDAAVLATARIIAGELGSTHGAAKTFSPVQMWDVSIPTAGSFVDIPYPSDFNCIVFVRRGSIEIMSGDESSSTTKSSKLMPQDVALMTLSDGSDSLRIRGLQKDTSVMILGGEPLNEPIAARGPFVMNTQEELRQAVVDFQSGKMGR